MRDFTSNIDDDSIMRARADRNCPDIDPGMNDDDDDSNDGWEGIGSDSSWSEPFENKSNSFEEDDDFSSFNRPPMGDYGNRFPGGMNGNPFNNSGFSSQYGSPMQNNSMQNNEMVNPEDKFWNAVKTTGVESIGFLGNFVDSFKNFNVYRRKEFGKNLFISGFVLDGLAILAMIFVDLSFWQYIIAGLLGSAFGGIMFGISMDKYLKGETDTEVEYENEDDDSMEDQNWNDNQEDDNSFSYCDEQEDEETLSSDILDRLDTDEIENPFESRDNFDSSIELSVKSKEEIIDDLENKIRENQVDVRMLTKQYLYDTMISTLETRTPNYSKEEVLDEDSREFLAFCDIVKRAGEIVAPSNHQDDYPEIVQVKDTLFFTFLEITRPKWLKDKQVDGLVKEIVNACAFNPKTMEIDETITGSGTYAMGKIFIKIFKGETAMITIKDIYLSDKVRNEIVGGKMKMPLVFGIDTQGEELLRDFKDIHALLIAGAPRSGKTWFVKTLMAQLMMLNKPSEFEFYVIDAKTVTSDYFHLTTPHIKQFLTTDEEIITLLRELVHNESKRREQKFFEMGGVQNIEDFKKKNPFEKMPYILVVMDEVITISNRMDKELKAEFMGLLKEFTSRLPSLGIRILMVPHVIKNQVLDKTITDMIPYRISVKGDPEAVEAITGATPRQFPIKLNHMGDIAFKVDNSGVLFAHTPIISDTNEGFDDFYKFLTDFWLHIEPESFKGSKLEKDILSGLRKVEDFPAIKDEYKEEVTEKRAKIVAARNVNRIEKPMSKLTNKPTSEKSSGSSFERVSAPQVEISRITKETYGQKGPKLTKNEIDELLKDVHKPSNIKQDDLLS